MPNVDINAATVTPTGGSPALVADLFASPPSQALTAIAASSTLTSAFQGLHANLTALAGLTLVTDRLPYANGSGTLSLATFTAAGRALIDDADASAQRTTLGLGTAAIVATGTSGTTIPLLDGVNTWSGQPTFAAGTIVISKPFTITQTWNDGSVTFNPLLVNVTATASAAASTLMDLQVASVSQFKVSKAGLITSLGGANLGNSTFYVDTITSTVRLWTGGAYEFSSTNAPTAAADLILARDAANTLAQRNSTTAQAFRVYNTYTDASNYERGEILWTSNEFTIQTKGAGTGTTTRALSLGTVGAGILNFFTTNTTRWKIDTSGHFLANVDNTYDIGASGATRPRTVYAGTSVITPALRIDQAPTAISQAVDTTINSGADGAGNIGHRVSVNLNGTTYWIPCSTTAF